MKMKTNELIGAALDWAVARCEGGVGKDDLLGAWYAPSTDWSQGGAIIEREEISISREFSSGRVEWAAWTPALIRDDAEAFGYGETPLVAAMRCYVVSKLGDEVDVPDWVVWFVGSDELMKGESK
jgi:hypothetical protein